MKKHHNQFVRCVENIQDLSLQGHFNYALLLGGGLAVSRKTIKYNPKTKKYKVFNHIDDSTLYLTEKELFTESNIGKAMKLRALIAEIS